MGQREKPQGATSGADTRDALARIARLISAADDSETGDSPAPGGRGEESTGGDSAGGEALSLASLRHPGAAQLLEALPAGLAVCKGDELIRANSAFALAFGYRSSDDLLEAGGLEAIFPGGAKTLARHLANGSSTQPRRVELQARSRSGREFLVPVAVHAIASNTDEKAGLIILHPETGAPPGPREKRAKTEPDGEKAAGKPDAKRRKKKRQKARAGRGALERMNKTEFLAKVSHELRTPLNSIIGFAEIMKDEQLGPVGNDRYRGYIRDIHDSGLYALSLVNDLLDLSKIEAGEFELNFTAVELDEVAAESVHSMEPQAKRQRVLLRTAFAEDLPPVLADRRSIRQIILNLVSNGVKFTRPGGQVIVSTQRTGSGGVRLRVRDTGIGMSKSEIAVALEPFQQLDTSPRRQAGTGLGLPLTKALVEANRAKFRLRSISERGTRIDVTFPKARVGDPRN